MSTRYFIILSMVVILGIVGYRYYHYVVKGDYVVLANVSCDPAVESCFVADCSPDEDPECDDTPYKKVEVLSAEAPGCLKEHTCEVFECTSESCSVTECSEDALEDGEVCAVPEPESEDEEEVEEISTEENEDAVMPQ